MISNREWKEVWDSDANVLKVYPNKTLILILLTAVPAIFIIFDLALFSTFTEIVIAFIIELIPITFLLNLSLTRYVLTDKGIYVHRWLHCSFFEWSSFREISIEKDTYRTDVLVICFNRGITRIWQNDMEIQMHPFKFFVFEFKGQVSSTLGKLQVEYPLVDKEEMLAFIEKCNLDVKGMELL